MTIYLCRWEQQTSPDRISASGLLGNCWKFILWQKKDKIVHKTAAKGPREKEREREEKKHRGTERRKDNVVRKTVPKLS